MNKVIEMGNLTADVELKTTPNGVPVATFTIAVKRRFAKQGDEVKADFFNCVAWRNTAEFVSKYFAKGKAIAVVGVLQNRSWTDQNGQKRYITEIVVDEAYFAGSANGQNDSPAQQTPAPANFEEIPAGEDLPF